MVRPLASEPARVAVIGAGIIGLSCAWRLADCGIDVTVLDAGSAGQGASFAAAGMLAPAFEAAGDGIHPALYDFCMASNARWPDFAARLEAATGRSLGYQPGPSLAVGTDPSSLERLNALSEALRRRGQTVVPLTSEEAKAFEPTLSNHVQRALQLPFDGQIDNRAVILALLGVCQAHQRIQLRCGVAVSDVGGLARDYDRVLISAGWRSKALSPILQRLEPIGGQLLSVRVGEGTPRVTLRCDDLYIAPKADRVVIGATIEPGEVREAPDPKTIDALQERAAVLCPGLGTAERIESWSGVRPGFPDHAPVMGRLGASHVFVATGHHRNGVLLAPETASLMTALMLDDDVPVWAKVFAPGRQERIRPV